MRSRPLLNKSLLSGFLARLLCRSPLGKAERRAILALPGEIAAFQSNRNLGQGSKRGFASLVLRGLVAQCEARRNGAQRIKAFFLPGDMCDLASVVVHEDCGLQALCSSTILQIPLDALEELAVRYPAIALAFWRDCAADASMLGQRVANSGSHAISRTAHLFCEMGVRFEAAGLGARHAFVLDMSQTRLAEALGMTNIHMNRVLQELRLEDLIVTYGRNVRIPDWDRLATVGEFDPAYLLLPDLR